MFLHQMTPFHVTAEHGRCANILGCLIAKGGDKCINSKDEDGVSSIHMWPFQVETKHYFDHVTTFEVLYCSDVLRVELLHAS